ncbi:MAG: hypothetical protein V4619_04205 [Bacteroidota bacterium]
MKNLLLLLLALCTTGIAIAQKQKVNYTAPQNIKVDGLAKEWGGKYQNNNRKNELRYTVTNNDKNLYLVIYTADFLAIDKIGRGGITFTISKLTDKKQRRNATDNAVIQYPVRDLTKDMLNLGDFARQYKDFKEEPKTNKREMDSLINLANTRFSETYKLLKVTGITAVADTFISIYNTHGIKAAARFDHNLGYVYELAVPLAHLDLDAASVTKLSYNIKLNGPPGNDEFIRAGRFPAPVVISISEPNSQAFEVHQFLNNPTDFWGEYTLAK